MAKKKQNIYAFSIRQRDIELREYLDMVARGDLSRLVRDALCAWLGIEEHNPELEDGYDGE